MTTATAFASGLASRLRQTRVDIGFSVPDLAAVTGLSSDQITRAETHGEITTADLEIIAGALRRPLDFFLYPEDEDIEVLLRTAGATTADTAAAIRKFARLVRDYEFLRELE